jgi:hypothetical protein
MNDAELNWLRGALTAQGYLLELLLGAQLLRPGDPAENLQRARNALDKQMRFDMRVPPTDTPPAQFAAIQTAALTHLHEMLDRVGTQIAGKPPASGGAG